MWVVEQPAGSLADHHPRFAELAKAMPLWRVAIRMGEYGGGTEKRTWLYSNYQVIEEVLDFRSR
eukprot:13292665-Alexandrium_andersonii.AAC.1